MASVGVEVALSLQVESRGESVLRGHRGWGFFACKNMVAFPDLPRKLIEESPVWDVLTIPLELTGNQDLPFERFRARCVETDHVLDDRTGEHVPLCLFELEGESLYRVEPAKPPTLAELEDSFRRSAAVVDALRLSNVPYPTPDPQTVLGPLGILDRLGKVPKTVFHRTPVNQEAGGESTPCPGLGWSICCWCCWCKCEDPRDRTL